MKTVETNLPAKADLAQLVKSLLPDSGYWLTKHDEPINDSVYATEDDAKDALELSGYSVATDYALVSLCLTVGWSPDTGKWSYQTGDNSYTGGAYGHPIWAVVWITADSVPAEVAEEILNELADQAIA